MLRPATPLSVLLFIAFILLLVSVISTPIVHGIKLASYNGIDYGVFGFCIDGVCSGVRVGYNPDKNNGDFNLPAETRHSLSSLLIVHPIAALFALILLFLSISAHLHAPSHSPRYLLGLLIFTLPTLLLSLLAFLVDILLFVPHILWAGWLVLAATILITASGVVICAMRRTVVSRRARKDRIAQNAEMNGENYYARQQAPAAPPPLSARPTAPLLNDTHNGDKLPSFTTYDASKESSRRAESDEQLPLQPRNPSQRSRQEVSPISGPGRHGSIPDDEIGRYDNGSRLRTGRSHENFVGARDEFGNPLPSSAAFGPPPGARRSPSDPRHRSPYGSNGGSQYPSGPAGNPAGPGGRDGRGAYFGGRGGYGRGQNNFRVPQSSGLDDDPRNRDGSLTMAGAGMAAMGQGHRVPPPGYRNDIGQGRGNGRGGGGGGGGPMYREPSPGFQPGQGYPYGRRPSPGPPSAFAYRGPSPGPASAPGYRNPSPSAPSPYGPNLYAGRRPSPGPAYGANGAPQPQLEQQAAVASPELDERFVGQAVEMDATTGSPSHPPVGLHDHVARELPAGLHDQNSSAQARLSPARDGLHPMSSSSVYSGGGGDAYIPARAAWADLDRRGNPDSQTHQPTDSSPVELPAALHSPVEPSAAVQPKARVGSGDNYYEDVDARFAEDPHHTTNTGLPSSLAVGKGLAPAPLKPQHVADDGVNVRARQQSDEDDVAEGGRSPTASDISHFTSVSQRGVNPKWQPPPGPLPIPNAAMRRPVAGQHQPDTGENRYLGANQV